MASAASALLGMRAPLLRLGLLASACALMGYAGGWHWTLDLFAHFRWQYLPPMMLGLAAAVSLRACSAMLLLGLGLVLNTCSLLFATAAAPSGSDAARSVPVTDSLKFLVVNIHLDTVDVEPLLRLIDQESPDLVAIVELSSVAAAALGVLDSRYPSRIQVPRDDPFGMGVWAVQPNLDLKALVAPVSGFPAIQVGGHADSDWSLWLIHPFPPLGSTGSGWRDAYLGFVADQVGNAGSGLVAGDFNATPWSAAYRRFRQQTGMADASAGHPPIPTWRPPGPMGSLLALPLDHLLHGRDWQVQDFRVGPDIGSDHRPLIVSLSRVRR